MTNGAAATSGNGKTLSSYVQELTMLMKELPVLKKALKPGKSGMRQSLNVNQAALA